VSFEKNSGKYAVQIAERDVQYFDQVVIACHADQAIALLDEPTQLEHELLSVWKYERNETVLHWDESFLPPSKRAWASWNFLKLHEDESDAPLLVSYHLNRLQGLLNERQFIVTLGAQGAIAEEKILRSFSYEHPLYDNAAIAAQSKLHLLNTQVERPRFAGSYFGYGFHEDAVRAGAHAALSLAGEPLCS
jgi:predicted NAD/FAD-binding protein